MPRPKDSKYDGHFNINHETKKAECKLCAKTINKNSTGMNVHLRSKHGVYLTVQNHPYLGENEFAGPSMKKNDVEPIEDQICREVAKYGASFR